MRPRRLSREDMRYYNGRLADWKMILSKLPLSSGAEATSDSRAITVTNECANGERTGSKKHEIVDRLRGISVTLRSVSKIAPDTVGCIT